MRRSLLAGITIAALACASLDVLAQDPSEAAAISPSVARRMPGPMHAKLEPLIGKWKMTGRLRSAPDAPWTETASDVDRRWILGGRFVEERVASDIHGEPWEGLGLIGYDNTREQFTMAWFENQSTGTWFCSGRLVDGQIVFEGKNSHAETGEKERWGKWVLDLEGERHTFLGYNKDASGREFQSMEMTATRR
jgi:hypothetical protein